MQDSPKQARVIFTAYREVNASNGTKFYWLTSTESHEICRIDERFVYLVEDKFPLLEQGQAVEFVCVPDAKDPKGWRLDLDYYRKLAMANTVSVTSNETQDSLDQPDTDLKSITFYISGEDHAFMTALHKRLKQIDPTYGRFADLNAYHFATLVRMLRMQHPDLAAVTRPLPF